MTILIFAKDLRAFHRYYLSFKEDSNEYKYVQEPSDIEGYYPPFGIIFTESCVISPEIKEALRRILPYETY